MVEPKDNEFRTVKIVDEQSAGGSSNFIRGNVSEMLEIGNGRYPRINVVG